MKRNYSQKHSKEKIIALERIESLFSSAKEEFSNNPALSNRYVDLARKISMKYKVRIKPVFKRQFCKHCHFFLVPSKNCRIRLSEGHITYLCFNCKKFMRFGYRPKK